MPEFERVHTVTDYYDGPRRGIADFGASPHLYESIFNDVLDDYSNEFHLKPVSNELFELALEDWSIWLRWETAHHKGTTTLDSHPALPEDRQRHDQLELILKEQLVISKDNVLRAQAEFRPRAESQSSGRRFHPLEVKWTKIGNVVSKP